MDYFDFSSKLKRKALAFFGLNLRYADLFLWKIRSRKFEAIPEATGRIPNEPLKKDLLGIQLEISRL